MSNLLKDLGETEAEILEILAPIYAEVRHWEAELARARQAKRAVASEIEARSDATPKSDAAEGESAVAESETPKPSRDTRKEGP